MQTNAWAGAGSSPTPGSLVSRRVGSGKRRRSGGARAEAPEVRGGRGLLREPVPRAGAGGQRVRGRPRRRDLSSRGASAREHAVVPAAPAPKLPRCAAGVDCFENPCLGWKERPKGSGLVPDAGICSFSSPRSASELIKAAAARAKADPDAPEGLPVDMARKTHKGAKGVAGALARAQLATASLGNFDAMRRRSRRAPAAPSGPRTATRPRASPVVHGRRRAQGRPGHRVRAPRGVGPRPARAVAEVTLDERVEERSEERVETLLGFDSPGVGGRSLCDAK